MGFGKKSSKPKKVEPKPEIVVQSGSGAGVTDGTTAQQQQRVETVADQTTLLSPQQQEEELLRKGIS